MPALALAGGVAEPWRQICPCQQHASPLQRWFRETVAATANRRGGFVIALSLAVGVAWIPLKATTAELFSQSQPELAIPAAAVSFAPLTVDHLFFAPRVSSHELLTERVREEFFTTEIPYGALIYREAKAHNLSPELVAAVARTESDFRPRLRSLKDAQGLMQLIPSTGKLMGAANLMEPTENVRAGVRYLRYLHRQFGDDQRLVLAAYNAGEGNVRRFRGIPPFRETQDYLRRVAAARQSYQQRVALRLATSLAPGSLALGD